MSASMRTTARSLQRLTKNSMTLAMEDEIFLVIVGLKEVQNELCQIFSEL